MRREITAEELTAPQGMSGLACEPWTPGEVYAVAADWAQASSPVLIWGDGEWTNDMHGRQVADFRHEPTDALRDLIAECNRLSGGADLSDDEMDAIVEDAVEINE